MTIAQRSVATATLTLLTAFAVFSLPATHARGAPGGTGSPIQHRAIRLYTWARAYLGLSRYGGGYAPHTHVVTPALWLYAPSGQAVGFFMRPDAARAQAVLVKFPHGMAQLPPLAREPTLAQMRLLVFHTSKVANLTTAPLPASSAQHAGTSGRAAAQTQRRIRELLVQQQRSLAGTSHPSYTAVLLVKTSECPTCEHFDKWLQAAAARDPGELSVVEVTLKGL